ncbi:hypothetical protein DFH09DRAFT_1364074 [Mycena vulgaris]|nr:hypothetical protein DFH09DRAFT_1367126 [Mycena vulgaris]KAJ6552484.1 hypothetical protein DFH09DRAFT_1366319 [Mycena vulgaris]KAJ6563691.1 hypothetical protein DFH09DRAFT_1364074 [Mycena vulgaris]
MSSGLPTSFPFIVVVVGVAVSLAVLPFCSALFRVNDSRIHGPATLFTASINLRTWVAATDGQLLQSPLGHHRPLPTG